MAKIVVAGAANCPYFAKVELLADALAENLPQFKLHKIVKQPDEWQTWLSDTCQERGWQHDKSPLVWRELVDRGGKGMLIGGANEFQEYAVGYYGNLSPLSGGDMKRIAAENLAVKTQVDAEESTWRAMVQPTRVCITKATSPVCYSMLDAVVSGELLGTGTDVALTLFDDADQKSALEGIAMENVDTASAVLREVSVSCDVTEAFTDAGLIILLDEVARDDEETEEQWYKKNYDLFTGYAKVINDVARRDVKVILAGLGPGNFNATMMLQNAPNVSRQNIVATSRLVEQHAKAILGRRLAVNSSSVVDVVVWGNAHGAHWVDVSEARVHHYDGAIWGPPSFSLPVRSMVHDDKWLEREFRQLCRDRRAEEEAALGHRPSASHARAVVSHVNQWWRGFPSGQIFSMAVASEGWYGVPKGLVFSFPVKLSPAGYWSVVQDFDITEETKAKIEEAVQDLQRERELIFPPSKPPTPDTDSTSGLAEDNINNSAIEDDKDELTEGVNEDQTPEGEEHEASSVQDPSDTDPANQKAEPDIEEQTANENTEQNDESGATANES